MRLSTRMHRRGDDESNLIPLINVVFLLLIFFMLAGRLARPDPAGLTPPESGNTETVAAGWVLLIDAAGQFTADDEPLDATNLAAWVQTRLHDPATGPLQVKADARLKAAQLITVLERLRAAGVEELQLLTVARKR